MKKERDDPERRVWECPACLGINAWCGNDADRAAELLTALDSKPWTVAEYANCREPQTISICHGSAFDNVCGHCGANLVPIDSPWLDECYTHEPRPAAA